MNDPKTEITKTNLKVKVASQIFSFHQMFNTPEIQKWINTLQIRQVFLIHPMSVGVNQVTGGTVLITIFYT